MIIKKINSITGPIAKFTITCYNLREFRRVIMRYSYLRDLFDQIKIGLSNHLFRQVSPISDLSQLPV
jgi:hypothetical protein